MKTIVHGFFTNGYFELAKIFTESFFMFNSHYPLILDAVCPSDDQQNKLYTIAKKYNANLSIAVTNLNYEQEAQRLGIPIETLKAYQHEVENNFGLEAHKIDLNAKVWKLMMAGDMRVKAVYRLLKNYNVINFDIDTLFRDNISRLETIMQQNDVSAKIRLKNGPKMAISIGLVAYQHNENVIAWVKEWIRIIDSIGPMKRPLGYGQISCYQAYQKFKDKMRFYNLIKNAPEFGRPWVRGPNDIIWTANTHGIAKKEYVTIFGDELRRLKNDTNKNT